MYSIATPSPGMSKKITQRGGFFQEDYEGIGYLLLFISLALIIAVVNFTILKRNH